MGKLRSLKTLNMEHKHKERTIISISGIRFTRAFIKALGIIKKNVAQVNFELGLLDQEISKVIQGAAQEIIDGNHDTEFVVDIFQTGSGTSSV